MEDDALKPIYERLDEQDIAMAAIKQQLEMRLKLLSAASGLAVAIGIALISGVTWEYKSDNQSFRFGLSAETITQLFAVGIPSIGAGSAVAIAISREGKKEKA